MFTFRSTILPAAFGACLFLGAVGCHHDNDDMKSNSMSMDTSNMSKTQMLHKGEWMMNQGEQMKMKAMKMNDSDMMDGMSKQQMMDKGNQMMADGQAMKDKAKAM